MAKQPTVMQRKREGEQIGSDGRASATVDPTGQPSPAPQRAKVIEHPSRRRLEQVRSTTEKLLVRQQSLALQLVAEFAEQEHLDAGLTAVVNLLHHRYHARRVSIGTTNGSRVDIRAVSQQARIEANTREIDLLQAVLCEAREQDRVSHVNRIGDGITRLVAHQALCAGLVDPQIITVPMYHAGRSVAGLCLEFDGAPPVSNLTLGLFEQIGSLLAPLIETRQRADRNALDRALDSLRDALHASVEPRSLAALLLGGASLLVLVSVSLVPVTHNVASPAEVVAMQRRVITAPQDGFIERVLVGVGDRVAKGASLLQLSTVDLTLEVSRWNGELRRHSTEMRAAMALGDRKEIAVLRARRRQAEAELALVENQLERSSIVAPEPGIVVSGELAQLTGSAIERGQSLLEIAPEQGYQIHLMVNESDIGWVVSGQTGRLMLNADPGRELSLTTVAIHPISVAVDGQNRFRVEAVLQSDDVALLPGQTGVGKIEVGRARLGWLWTHRFTEWLDGVAWRWLG